MKEQGEAKENHLAHTSSMPENCQPTMTTRKKQRFLWQKERHKNTEAAHTNVLDGSKSIEKKIVFAA